MSFALAVAHGAVAMLEIVIATVVPFGHVDVCDKLNISEESHLTKRANGERPNASIRTHPR